MPIRASPQSRTVAVAGGKGGCGKTTTALGVALALVRRGQRPIVVDTDVDVPDLHIRAGVDREPGLSALASGDRPVCVLQSSREWPGVDVIAAGSVGPPVEVALRRLTDLERPVLVDCPAGAGPDAAAPLRIADATLLVSTRAPESRLDAAKTARMAEALDAPPVATVLVESLGGRARVGDHETGTRQGSSSRRIAETTAISVPRVTGSPLSSDRVLDRYVEVSLELFN